MAYIKTNWVKDVTPMDTDNLNKIENGIGNLDAGVTANATQIASLASGSPKGTYTTLALLQSAFPTGNTNIYLVTADGKWYYWNGTAWTIGGTYQSTGIAFNSVVPAQLTFAPVQGMASKNIFNLATVTSGKYIDYTNGNLVTNVAYYYSDYIYVLPSTIYHKVTTAQFAFYDVNKVYISGLNTNTTFTTPSNCVYIRLSFRNITEVNAEQVELGSVLTSYETFYTKININSMKDSLIPATKLAFTPVIGTMSRNLFNKAMVTISNYIGWDTGNMSVNASYSASDWIPVNPSTAYYTNTNGQFAFYTASKVYISGVASGHAFTTPSNCAYVRLSLRLSTNDVELGQLELGSIGTSYVSYIGVINRNQINNYQIVVAKKNGDYTTINEAISKCADSISNPVTILIMPGVYEESVLLIGRYITLIGTNKETCIIKTYTNDYHFPPIDIGANSNLYNLTIIADDNGIDTPQTDGVAGVSAYAIHHDIAGRGYDVTNVLYQGTSRVKNCILESKHYQALGSGLANKETMIFEDCEFIAYNISAAFRVHNYFPTGGTLCKLIVKNCIMHNDGIVEPIRLQEVNHTSGGGYDNVDTVVTFINNVAYNETNGKSNGLLADTPFDSSCVSGYIKLGKASFGNSITQLNS